MIELRLRRRLKVKVVRGLTAPMYYDSWRAEIRSMIYQRWNFEVNYHCFERNLDEHTIFKHRSLALFKGVTAARCSLAANCDLTADLCVRTPAALTACRVTQTPYPRCSISRVRGHNFPLDLQYDSAIPRGDKNITLLAIFDISSTEI